MITTTRITTQRDIILQPYDWFLVLLLGIYFISDRVFLYLASSNSFASDISVEDMPFFLGLGYFLVNSIVALLDEAQLKNKLKDAPSTFFALFLVPVYLFQRGTIVKKGRYSFWAYMIIFILGVSVDCVPDLLNMTAFTPSYQKIETLKEVEFARTGMAFGDFVKNKAPVVKYSAFSNETGEYVAVTLENDNINNPTKIRYCFNVRMEGDLCRFSLSHANITFDGNTWYGLGSNAAAITLFGSDKPPLSITPKEWQKYISN